MEGASRCALQPLLNAVDDLLPPPHLPSPLSAPPIFRRPLPHSLPVPLSLFLPPSVYTSSFSSSSLEHPRCWCRYKYPPVALTAEQQEGQREEQRTGEKDGTEWWGWDLTQGDEKMSWMRVEVCAWMACAGLLISTQTWFGYAEGYDWSSAGLS